jgi:conjugal transfer pilus assembly protein TraB
MASVGRLVEKLTPKQGQYAMLALIGLGGFGVLWLVLALGAKDTDPALRPGKASNSPPTNIGVMSPGQQVNPVDQWVGTAGRRLSQYEQEREQQDRINRDRRAFEEKTMQRFADLEQRLLSQANAPSAGAASTAPAAAPHSSLAPRPPQPGGFPPDSALPRAASLPPPPPPRLNPSSAGAPTLSASGSTLRTEAAPALVRVTLASDVTKGAPAGPDRGARDAERNNTTLDNYLPVSFTRGVLLGGLDAPTGGQSQSNPHPVLIRLSDNSVLPNRFRAEYRECFVIAAGYGDISSERAYLRTENLSCVRPDGTALEVKIQGSVYGEDGKYGMRGRLVTKQGAMLANALLAGIVGGIGQGISSYNSTVSTSTFGTVATQSGDEALRAGVGTGVGRALDRLAQYYIKLAEQTFPVIEVDAGREIDVVITKGVRIEAAATARAAPTSRSTRPNAERFLKVADDEDS